MPNPNNKHDHLFEDVADSRFARAAGVVFFAYVGFDMVPTASQDARNPRRDIPLERDDI
jgi:basic amino acid/polyamine antiporter, APA family